MSQPENYNASQRRYDPYSLRFQEECLLYFKRYRRLHALPVGWTERCETYPDGARQLFLTNGQYHVMLYPGDYDTEPRVYGRLRLPHRSRQPRAQRQLTPMPATPQAHSRCNPIHSGVFGLSAHSRCKPSHNGPSRTIGTRYRSVMSERPLPIRAER
jgi:hypothetical protein